MPLEFQNAVVDLVVNHLGAELAPTPAWLKRPAPGECREHWPLIQDLYRELTDGSELPATMPPRERRQVDAVLVVDGHHRSLEVDEKQHFNRYRSMLLRRYASSVPLAFPHADWIAAGDRKTELQRGGFGRPRPPLFPHADGRHRQRAFRDALADIVPLAHGWLPTLRIADFEAKTWVFTEQAAQRMTALLSQRLATTIRG